jgi:hypothetical protein
MRKTVLTFGLIGGGIIAILMSATLPFADRIGFDKGMIVGYTTMVAAFLMVFFGIRSYRENVGDGQISFGRAVAVGALITLIVSVFYVATWEVIYFKFMPDFCDRYAAYAIAKARAAGASPAQIQAKTQEMATVKTMLQNPLTNAAMAFIEPLPVGVLITLISAAVLRKKKPEQLAT